MSTTTHGWAEYRQEGWSDDPLEADGWRAVVNLGSMLARGDSFYGSLFGVHNDAMFEPVAPARGMPEPLSRIGRLDFANAPSETASWVSLAELRAVDWTEEPDLTAISSHRGWTRAVLRTEKRDSRGRLVAEDVDAWAELPADVIHRLAQRREITYDGQTYRVYPKQRRDLAVHDWPTLWNWLEDLSENWSLDPANLRLVVWFV
jgi:hypothetical protein